MASAVPVVAVRGSTGVSLHQGPPSYELVSGFPRDDSKSCKCMLFSPNGEYFAWANGKKVTIISTQDWKILAELDRPKVCFLQFSPKGTYIMTWEIYAVTKEHPEGSPNLYIYKASTGELLVAAVQKNISGWEPLWTSDEALFSRNVKNDVLFFDPKNPNVVVNRVANQRVHNHSISPGPPPYFVLAYIPGKQGQPSLGKLFQYPKFDTTIASRTFLQVDKVQMQWNRKGSHVLVIAEVEVDKTGSSYYGKQTLHFISTKGETALVPLNKEGPVYSVEWSPLSTEFCVLYGFMPAKATIFNLKCDPVFELGESPRNSIYYNHHGNILLLGGFGNLPGNVELWDVSARKLINKMTAPLTTGLSWSPDSQHFMTGTTAPRLRTCNGFHVWHYTGTLLYERPWNKQEELWEVMWQNVPEGTFPIPQISYKPVEGIASSHPQASKEVYRPPIARGKVTFKPMNDTSEGSNMSKNALKLKKKRENKKAAKALAAENPAAEDAEEPSTVKPATIKPPTANGIKAVLEEFTTEDPVKLKKLGRLRSKLLEIERLKDQQKSGKQLEKNQLEKINKEDQLLKEMKDLAL